VFSETLERHFFKTLLHIFYLIIAYWYEFICFVLFVLFVLQESQFEMTIAETSVSGSITHDTVFIDLDTHFSIDTVNRNNCFLIIVNF